MKIYLNLHLLVDSLYEKRDNILQEYSDKWLSIVRNDSIEHLTIPRGMLFGWGTMILILQTLSIFARIEIFMQIAGMVWLLIFFLFRQYCRIWKHYYSVFWPILIHFLALVAAVYIKARYL